MIKIEKILYPTPSEIEVVIEGMRNPMNSWGKSDSFTSSSPNIIGPADSELMLKLAAAGPEHRKYLRMMQCYMRITAPLYWWKEADTYKIGTVANSCSTMHKIMAKEFTLDDFSHEHLSPASKTFLLRTIEFLNQCREAYINYTPTKDFPEKKDLWWQIIQLLPSSYNQTRNVMFNYETLLNIYFQRKDHKLDEWKEFCKTIKEAPILYDIIEKFEKKDKM